MLFTVIYSVIPYIVVLRGPEYHWVYPSQSFEANFELVATREISCAVFFNLRGYVKGSLRNKILLKRWCEANRA